MKGVIAITDWDWFTFLGAQPDIDEVNFWRPSDTSKPGFPPGTPLIFKLKKKHGDWIVGFGTFARHSVLPEWMAWEAFEVRNGAPTAAEMRRRIQRLRHKKGLADDASGNNLIGCLMLSAPVFFDRAAWIRPPADWSEYIVQSKGYDLTQGEGARVWNACLAAAAGCALPLTAGGLVADAERPRFGALALGRSRLGQGTFRIAVTDAYGRACAVTGEHSLPVLEAAHIRPYSDDGPHDISNGLLLRTDIHRLYDRGYVTVTPEHRFEVSRRLKDEFENGKTYYAMQGKIIHLPRAEAERPSREYLEWHARERFRA
jgi:putative restriction endonuclease